MNIYKATITVTVFLREPIEQQARDALGEHTLETLAQEMDDGLMVGDHHLTAITLVDPDKVHEELVAVGNDGDFFAMLDDQEDAD